MLLIVILDERLNTGMNPMNFELLVVRRTPTRLVNPVLKPECSNRNESNVKTRMNSVLKQE